MCTITSMLSLAVLKGRIYDALFLISTTSPQLSRDTSLWVLPLPMSSVFIPNLAVSLSLLSHKRRDHIVLLRMNTDHSMNIITLIGGR